MDRDEQRDSIDTVSKTTEGQAELDTQFVDEGSAEEREYSEGGVESSVLKRNVSISDKFTRSTNWGFACRKPCHKLNPRNIDSPRPEQQFGLVVGK
jgi:hypothetical protein